MSTMRPDLIVIGGGIHGCSTALHCALRGLKVLLLEKDYAGRHSSGVNAGGCGSSRGMWPRSPSPSMRWSSGPASENWSTTTAASLVTVRCWWPRPKTSSKLPIRVQE